jgi:hypothetical protein
VFVGVVDGIERGGGGLFGLDGRGHFHAPLTNRLEADFNGEGRGPPLLSDGEDGFVIDTLGLGHESAPVRVVKNK